MLTENNLHNYQKTCVQHILNNPYCGLFIDMGLGKTVITLTAINSLIYDSLEIARVLVVAPKRVTASVWQEEAAKWEHLKYLRFSKITGGPLQRSNALAADADIYLISRDNIAWLCGLYGATRLPFDMVVIDELSSFKSYKSQRFKAMRNARIYLKRFVGLTGTPAPNSLLDLWPQIYLMDRGERLGKTISKYRSDYFRPGRTNGHVVYSYELLEGASELIHKKIEDICISMKDKDYLEMPPRTNNYIRLAMPEALKKQYKDFEREKLLQFGNNTINAANAAGLSNKLLQFANGAVYDEQHTAHAIHDIKLEALKEIVDDANGQPVLIAWIYQFDRDRIKEYLAEYGPRELKTEKDIADWNRGDVRVMLAHPASAGHGLNLQAGGHIIIWFGLTWSLELYQQFNGRLYRQGQKNSVVINHLILAGTHDEDIVRALESKDRQQTSLLDSIKAKITKYLKNT